MKGKITYIPRELVNEIDFIKKEKCYDKDSKAINEIVRYSRIGKQFEDTIIWDIGKMHNYFYGKKDGFKRKK